ncbi:MAG: FadR/GntR family transcriptional regulator [Solirubrobacterales bacterium]
MTRSEESTANIDDQGSVAPDGTFDFEPLRGRQLYERVADEIAAQVRAGALKPGDRLPGERTMAQQLEVGRTTVHEAIASLQVSGIVETRRGAGSVVAEDALERLEFTEGTVREERSDASPAALLEVRELIEPAAARRAASLGKRDKLAESLLTPQPEPLDLGDPAARAAWNDRDRLFHRQIGEMTGNPIMGSICGEISETMNQVLWQHLRDSVLTDFDRVRLFEAEHQMIYEAIASGDPDAAEFHGREHIKRVRRYMALDQ